MEPKDVKNVVVVGAGAMGHSIAQVFSQSGIEVGLVDKDEKILDRAMKLIRSNLETLSKFGRLEQGEIPAILERIHPSTDLGASAKGADFAVEAISEIPEAKKEVFSKLDEALPKETIIASNTSSLNVFEISEIKNPKRLVIAHWFAPPHVIPLVEVVPGAETSPDVVEFTTRLMKALGKRPVVMKEFVQGFIVNRIQRNIGLAVMEFLSNGWATPEDIDLAVKTSLGVRLPIVGVVQTFDFTGLDVLFDVIKSFGLNNPMIEEKVKDGHLGVKTSKGLFDYGGRTEEEILKERDERYLGVLEQLEKIEAFEPV